MVSRDVPLDVNYLKKKRKWPIKVRITVTYGGRERVTTELEDAKGAFGVFGRVLFPDLGCSNKGIDFIIMY